MAGGCLVLLSEAERADIQRVLDIYLEREIERAVMPVVVLHLLAERILARPPERLALREILATGEQLKITPAVAELLRRYPALRLFNDYGPTESNVITALEVTRRADHYGALPPIGRAVAGCHCYILDRYLQPLPAGMPGELYLAGEGLARGYAGRPGFTAERFLPDPLSEVPGARMYRSGDLARLRRDGELELLGRSDDQLKIRGFRVEPAEVEIALRRHPRVRDCLVLGRDFPGEDRRLVAYVIPAEGAAPDAAELQAHLGEGLPGYMVPAHVVTLERFPLNANGKIDRTALPMPEIGARSEARQGPRTDLEAAILAIWAEVLETPDIDIRDDFFSLGGHSLLIIRIIARLREELNVQVPLADFMDAPTVEQLAVTVTAHLAESGDADELAGLLDELEAGETPAAETAAPQVLDARVVLAAMRTHGAEAEGPAPVAVLGVPSSNRPDSLAACLKSYLANAQAFGHAPELVVCGTQRDAATEAAYRGRLSEIEERFGASVLYAGEAEKLRFAQTLAQAAGVDPSVVRFALADTEQAGLPYGTNRNALLLHNAGRAFVSVDDDTRADLYILPGPRNGYEVVGEPGVSEIRVLADRAAALAEVEAARFDWLGSHAAMLGAEAAYLLREANDLDTDRASAGPLACLAEGRGRVAASYHGWVGDSGWANPEDARWLAGASLEWITATPERYATALASREAVRGVHGPTLGRGGDFFCLSAGFDARRPLVPFLPVQRREDALFGWLATRADPELLAAHLPGLVLHDRQTGSPAPTATREAVDLAMLVQAALADIGGLPSDAADRLQALGAGLQAACAQTPDDFDAWLRGAVEAQQARDFAEVEARLAAWPAERAYWAHDAEVALQMARRRASAPDAHLPLRLGGTDRTARLAKTRHLLDLFGRLTEAWPTLMREAAELREDGRGLAQPAGLATLAS
jgi:acyl carrier protein